MYILFPNEPFEPGRVDPSFEEELEAAKSIGFRTMFYDHEELLDGNVRTATKRLHTSEDDEPVLFRGWMMSGENYSTLARAIDGKGYNMVSKDHHYEMAHYLPSWYLHVRDCTARSAWVSGDNVDDAWRIYQPFAGHDAVIKDYVKSAKYRWKDGCFIPRGTDYERFCEIFAVFREERGNLFNRGVVIREFVPFVEKGGKVADLPILNEKRIFFFNGKIVAAGKDAPVDNPLWENLAQKFQCPFMTIDVAEREDGQWRVMECGDGGVSGLPLDIDPVRFYSALHNAMTDKYVK